MSEVNMWEIENSLYADGCHNSWISDFYKQN